MLSSGTSVRCPSAKSLLMTHPLSFISKTRWTLIPVAFMYFSSLTQVLEGFLLMKLSHLKGCWVFLLGVTIVLVKLNSMVIIPLDFIPMLVMGWHAIRPELGWLSILRSYFISPVYTQHTSSKIFFLQYCGYGKPHRTQSTVMTMTSLTASSTPPAVPNTHKEHLYNFASPVSTICLESHHLRHWQPK